MPSFNILSRKFQDGHDFFANFMAPTDNLCPANSATDNRFRALPILGNLLTKAECCSLSLNFFDFFATLTPRLTTFVPLSRWLTTVFVHFISREMSPHRSRCCSMSLKFSDFLHFWERATPHCPASRATDNSFRSFQPKCNLFPKYQLCSRMLFFSTLGSWAIRN